MNIRNAEPGDAERLLEIYSYYVEQTAVSYECETPSLDEFRNRILETQKNYPYFVAEEGGAIVGYAYAGPFKARAGYRFSCEVTIYLDHNCRGCGFGRGLYEALEAELKERGFRNLYACIADPPEEDEYLTKASERFHARLGFVRAGTFHGCAYKFGRWYNMIWMEKIVGERDGRN